jgi:hypothetical protein
MDESSLGHENVSVCLKVFAVSVWLKLEGLRRSSEKRRLFPVVPWFGGKREGVVNVE